MVIEIEWESALYRKKRVLCMQIATVKCEKTFIQINFFFLLRFHKFHAFLIFFLKNSSRQHLGCNLFVKVIKCWVHHWVVCWTKTYNDEEEDVVDDSEMEAFA